MNPLCKNGNHTWQFLRKEEAGGMVRAVKKCVYCDAIKFDPWKPKGK